MHKMLRCLLFIFLLLSLLCASGAYARDPAPVHTVDGEYIRGWLVIGPFFPDNLDKDFLADVSGEANINPRDGDIVTTADGSILTWKPYQSRRDIIDLLDAVGNHEQQVLEMLSKLFFRALPTSLVMQSDTMI